MIPRIPRLGSAAGCPRGPCDRMVETLSVLRPDEYDRGELERIYHCAGPSLSEQCTIESRAVLLEEAKEAGVRVADIRNIVREAEKTVVGGVSPSLLAYLAPRAGH